MFGLVHQPSGEFCEIFRNECYEAHRTQEAAQIRADELNADAERNGYESRYHVEPLPDFVIVHFEDRV